MDNKRIVVCGGHLAPALAIIQLLLKKKDYKLFFFGRKKAAEGDQSLSFEYLTILRLKIPFYSLDSFRFPRQITWSAFLSFTKLPLSLIQSFYYLLKIKPKVVLSFGSYVALPVCLAAWLMRVPIITHEQTTIFGLANRIIGRLAQVVCLSWPDTKYVPRIKKRIMVGNPIREDIFFPVKASIVDFGDKNLPLLYVTGGSLGSFYINKIISQTLSYLLTRFRIIHQCGSTKSKRDYQMLLKLKDSLPQKSRQNYQLAPHFDPTYIGAILNTADLVISRSGVNTVSEIAAVGVPAIFIPLPWAANNEQEHNAKMLKNVGLVEILRQEKTTPEEFINTVESMVKNLSYYRKNAYKAKALIKANAGKHLLEILKFYL